MGGIVQEIEIPSAQVIPQGPDAAASPGSPTSCRTRQGLLSGR